MNKYFLTLLFLLLFCLSCSNSESTQKLSLQINGYVPSRKCSFRLDVTKTQNSNFSGITTWGANHQWCYIEGRFITEDSLVFKEIAPIFQTNNIKLKTFTGKIYSNDSVYLYYTWDEWEKTPFVINAKRQTSDTNLSEIKSRSLLYYKEQQRMDLWLDKFILAYRFYSENKALIEKSAENMKLIIKNMEFILSGNFGGLIALSEKELTQFNDFVSQNIEEGDPLYFTIRDKLFKAGLNKNYQIDNFKQLRKNQSKFYKSFKNKKLHKSEIHNFLIWYILFAYEGGQEQSKWLIKQLILAQENVFPDDFSTLMNVYATKRNETKYGVGTVLPKKLLIDINKSPVEFLDYRGKTIFINFWYPSCAGCLMRLPELHKLNNKKKRSSFIMISIGNGTSDALKKYLKRHPYPGIVIPSGDKFGSVINELGVNSFPYIIVADETGHIVYRGMEMPKGYN